MFKIDGGTTLDLETITAVRYFAFDLNPILLTTHGLTTPFSLKHQGMNWIQSHQLKCLKSVNFDDTRPTE